MSTDPLIGTRVGEYDIVEAVGEGGMGVVYRAVQPLIKKRVAIKVLKPSVATDEVQVRRLITEAEAVNAIGHRGIIDIFSLGTLSDGRPYVVMEYLDGEALDLWLQKQPGARVTVQVALELLIEMCAPLAAAHHANVIHRDLKPSNVFICTQADGTKFLKLLDFGLAKRAVTLDGSTKQTNQATVAGTPDYMAPEQARGLEVSPRSDIYSLGIIAFELITGRVPFGGATPMDVMVAHVGQPPPQPRDLEPSVPESLNDLLLRMLAKPPEARPQSAEEVRAAFEAILEQMGFPRSRPSGEFQALPTPSSPSGISSMATPQTPPQPVEAPPVVAGSRVEEAAAEAPLEPPKQKSRWPLFAGLLVVLAAPAAYFAMPKAVEEQPAPVAAVTPPPAQVAPPPVEVVDAGPPAVEVEVVQEAPKPAPVPVAVEPPAPTQPELKARLAKDEQLAKKKKLSAKVRAKLTALKKTLPAADQAEERIKLQNGLESFERSYLGKKP